MHAGFLQRHGEAGFRLEARDGFVRVFVGVGLDVILNPLHPAARADGHVVVGVLNGLLQDGKVDASVVDDAIARYGIDPDAADPLNA